eukprot:1177233-Prorocentrum_minimum.AAC.2
MTALVLTSTAVSRHPDSASLDVATEAPKSCDVECITIRLWQPNSAIPPESGLERRPPLDPL